MNARLKNFLSLALVLCLAMTFSAAAFADGGDEPAPSRAIVCPACSSGMLLEKIEYGFIYTEQQKHYKHWDYLYWNVDLHVSYCDTCSYRVETVLKKNYIVNILCPGLPRMA